MSWMDDYLRRAALQTRLIEQDVIAALGWRTRLPKAVISRLGFEVIYQRPPGGGPDQYRGIARRGVMLIDHRSEWPVWSANPAARRRSE